MNTGIRSLWLCVLLTLFSGIMLAFAGAFLETFDITGNRPAPVPGHIAARVVRMQWDPRCIPVPFHINNTLDPIPNPLGEDFLTLEEATAALRQALETWTAIPTSFIDLQLVGTTDNPGLSGFDMVSEITFRTDLPPDLAGQSNPIALIRDVVLSAGDDIDGDGDADVASGISVCQDVDGDGDIEFPEGFYEAGTILESDVELNSASTRFTVDPQDADPDPDSMDLIAAAVHELGHAHGLAHTLIDQLSARDGTQATMYPFFGSTDPANELALRSLEMDDIAWSSVLYPEGSETKGPGALQPGDRAFSEVFGRVTGRVRHGKLRQPVAGASVFAVDAHSGAVVSSAISGTTQCSVDPAVLRCTAFTDPTFSVLDGQYILPVPAGTYHVGVEAVDGLPVPASNVNFTTQIGALLGQQNFPEEFYNGQAEGALEVRPGRAKAIHVQPGEVVADINFVTNRTIALENFGSLDLSTRALERITGVATPPGRFYAVRIPAEQIAQIKPEQNLLIQGATFRTILSDLSVTPVFAQALLTTGVVQADGTATLDLQHPLARDRRFVAQGDDFTPWYFPHPRLLGRLVREGIDQGEIQGLFLVLQVPTTTPFPGPSGFAPGVGLDGFVEGIAEDDDDTPALGLSFISDDGGATFIPVADVVAQKYQRRGDFNIMFSLILSKPPPQRNQ